MPRGAQFGMKGQQLTHLLELIDETAGRIQMLGIVRPESIVGHCDRLPNVIEIRASLKGKLESARGCHSTRSAALVRRERNTSRASTNWRLFAWSMPFAISR